VSTIDADTERSLRIGEVAELVGTTTRTIRYYEEIGLLPGSGEREQGKHRCYTQADVERMREIVRLRDLLGLSLEQLSQLLEAESARAELRREWKLAESGVQRRRILDEALEHVGTQLELVRGRRAQLEQLEGELEAKRQSLHERLAELTA
jgi:DNA-binding transcriptional MerR regulator